MKKEVRTVKEQTVEGPARSSLASSTTTSSARAALVILNVDPHTLVSLKSAKAALGGGVEENGLDCQS